MTLHGSMNLLSWNKELPDSEFPLEDYFARLKTSLKRGKARVRELMVGERPNLAKAIMAKVIQL